MSDDWAGEGGIAGDDVAGVADAWESGEGGAHVEGGGSGEGGLGGVKLLGGGVSFRVEVEVKVEASGVELGYPPLVVGVLSMVGGQGGGGNQTANDRIGGKKLEQGDAKEVVECVGIGDWVGVCGADDNCCGVGDVHFEEYSGRGCYAGRDEHKGHENQVFLQNGLSIHGGIQFFGGDWDYLSARVIR